MVVNEGKANEELREYTPALPTYYNKNNIKKKVCLSYFINILYDKDSLDTLVISIVCMPNGELEEHYKERVLAAGKNLDKTRFRFANVPTFEMLESEPTRIKVVYFDRNMDDRFKNRLTFFNELYIAD